MLGVFAHAIGPGTVLKRRKSRFCLLRVACNTLQAGFLPLALSRPAGEIHRRGSSREDFLNGLLDGSKYVV
jgi:hypothetical protein